MRVESHLRFAHVEFQRANFASDKTHVVAALFVDFIESLFMALHGLFDIVVFVEPCQYDIAGTKQHACAGNPDPRITPSIGHLCFTMATRA